METIPLREKKTWASYDLTNFPIVNVKLKGKINSEEDFNHFTSEWLEVYKLNQKFNFVFDATEVGAVSMKYAFKMGDFIKKLKREYENSILKSSIIITNSRWVRFLLKVTFWSESPVAPVYVTDVRKNTDIKPLLNNVNNDKNVSCYK